MIIGYARVTTTEWNLDLQRDTWPPRRYVQCCFSTRIKLSSGLRSMSLFSGSMPALAGVRLTSRIKTP